MNHADRDRKRPLDDSTLIGPRSRPGPRPPRGPAYPPRGPAYPPRGPAGYPPRRAGGDRPTEVLWVAERGPRGARRRPVKRLAALALGAAMVTAGAFAVVVAFNGGPGHQMGGEATQIPSSVGVAPPKLEAIPMAAPLPPSEPVRIEIPSLGVDAPVIQLGRDPNGAVQVPPLDNRNLAGWYDRTVLPGQAGTSVILGHVDNFTGPSVFFSIKMLRPRDIVKVVRADGKVAEFSVDGVQKVTKATFPSSAIYGNTRFPGLRLITCGGPFDSATRQYLDNIVVYSHLIS